MNIGTITANLVLNDRFSSTMAAAVRNMDQAGSKFDRLGQKLESVGSTMTMRVTAPMVALGAVAIRTGAEFEGALNKTAAVMNATAAEQKRLSDAATEWGQKTKFSNTEAAEAMLELAKAGFSAQETINALPATLELATAANLKLDEAASLTANTLRTFGLSTADLAHANDVLVAAANKSTINVADLRESLKFVGPVAKVASVSLADVAAASATLGSAGIKAEMAGTALRGTLSALLAPTKDTAFLLNQLGFAQELAAGKTVVWTDMLDRLKQKIDEGKGSADRFAGLVMEAFGQRAGPAVIAMANQGGAAIKRLSTEFDTVSQGSAKRFSEAVMKGTPGALKTMEGALETAAAKLQQMLAPTIIRVTGLVIRMADAFSTQLVPAFLALPQPIQDVTIALFGLAAATGPILLFLGTVGRLVGVAGAGARVFADGMNYLARTMATVAGLAGGVKLFFASPFGAAGASDAAFEWAARLDKLSAVIERVVFWIVDLGRVVGRLATPFTAILAASAGFLVWLYKVMDVGPSVSRIFENLWNIAGDLAGIFKGGLTIAWREFLAFVQPMARDLAAAYTGFSNLARDVNHVARALMDVLPWSVNFKTVLGTVEVVVAALALKIRQARQDLDAFLTLTGKMPKLPSPGVTKPFAAPGSLAFAVPEDPWGQVNKLGQKLGTNVGPLSDAAKKALEEVDKVMDQITGAAAIADARLYEQALAKMGGQGALTSRQLITLAHTLEEFRREGVALAPTLQAVRDRVFFFNDMVRDTNALLSITPAKLLNTTAAFRQFLQSDIDLIAQRRRFFDDLARRGPLTGVMLPSFQQQANVNSQLRTPNLLPGWVPALDAAAQSFERLGQIGNGALGSITRNVGIAFSAINGVVSAVRRFETALRAMGEGAKASTAMAVTNILQIVALIAQYGQQIADFMGDLFGTGPSQRALDLRNQIRAVGQEAETAAQKLDRVVNLRNGLQAIAQKSSSTGLLEKLLGNVQQVQEHIDQLTAAEEKTKKGAAAMEKYGLTMDALKSPFERAMTSIGQLAEEMDLLTSQGFSVDQIAPKMTEQLNGVLRAAIETGARLPASMRPFMESMIRSGGLADDLAFKLLGVKAPDVVPWKEMEAAAEKYGLKVDQLGERFRNSKLIAGAEELAKDWELLVGNGADVNAVMDKMSVKANTFLRNAMKWGLEVPASMRPMLEAMLRAGKLTDENGVKLENLDNVNWGLDIRAAIDLLIEKLDALFLKILNIPNPEITPKVNPPNYIGWDPKREFKVPDPSAPRIIDGPSPKDPGFGVEGFIEGSKGLRDFNPGGQYIEVHGREEVMTAGQSAGVAQWVRQAVAQAVASAGRSAGPGNVSVTAYFGDEQIKPKVVEWGVRAIEDNDGGGAAVGPRDRVAKALANRIPVFQR